MIAMISVISARNQVMGESSLGMLEEETEFFHTAFLVGVTLICYRYVTSKLPKVNGSTD